MLMVYEKRYQEIEERYQTLTKRKNEICQEGNGIYRRWQYPVLTREHIPIFWRYDLDRKDNPYFLERLGVNAVMNAGAIKLEDKYYLVARVEGNDRKSFFAVAESDNGVDNFVFWDFPVSFPDTDREETNLYDMRLTKHEDGFIYGIFCSERKDASSQDLSAATASAGIVRTKDLIAWERLPNLVTKSPQQRNVVLHPEFVNGKYALFTRPQDDFIENGSGGGICFGLCKDINHPVLESERLVSPRRYHTITEVKNGAGCVPIKTEKGWIHIAHGVRNTAAGLRYVLYVFATDLHQPWKVIAEPSGVFLAPMDMERVGDVSNVVFSNGAIVDDDGKVFIYYASSDTRLHVATTTLEQLVDYTFKTPADPLRSSECIKQRISLIEKNLSFMKKARARDTIKAQFYAGTFNTGSIKMKYQLFVPTGNYVKYPLVIHLHGAGERGEDSRLVLNNCSAVSFADPEFQTKNPCFVFAPQCKEEMTWRDEVNVDAVLFGIRMLMRKYPIDEDRVYITGISLGAIGTWNLIAMHGDIFAAAMPVCGAGELNVLEQMSDIPIWAFHAVDDDVVPENGSLMRSKDQLNGTGDLVNALEKMGRKNIKYTKYKAGYMLETYGREPHASWVAAYDDYEAKKWLFSKSKSDRLRNLV